MTENVQIPGYRLLRTLGEGGMATVYLAMQESLDREVALKVMSPVLAANETFCEQFMKEGRITAKLTHPHLMTVHDIGSYQGVYYLASEYLPAGTLRERMDRLSVAESLEIARDIASGLAYAHEKGFVHRDVKPGNIMFRTNGTAVLADFGIAKAMKSMSAATMAGNAIGTPDYMSPEQAQAAPVDGRSDLYSLGAVLYESLTGNKPYRAADAYAVALMHVTDPVPSLPENLSWLQPLIDGLMAKNPNQRFSTGEAFIAACDQLIQANPQAAASARERISSRRRAVAQAAPGSGAVAAPQAATAPGSRTRMIAIGVAALVLIAVAGLGWRWMHQPAATDTPSNPTVVSPTVPNPQPVQPTQPSQPVSEDAAASAAMAKLDMPTLLSRANEYLAYGQSHYGEKWSYPGGDNAIDLYNEALRREPGNAAATQGLAQIATYYENGARTALKNGLYAGADELVEKGLRADPKSAGLLKLKTELAKAEGG
jgi:serine/threonine-protein kinase PpkA